MYKSMNHLMCDIKALSTMVGNVNKTIDNVLFYNDPTGYERAYNRAVTAETKHSLDYAIDQLEQAVIAMINDLTATATTTETHKTNN